MLINIDGKLSPGVTSKDIILYIAIGQINNGTAGDARAHQCHRVRGLRDTRPVLWKPRMTICLICRSKQKGARAGG